jgi:2,4-dienoyl-CoA reductase-like NADH-dependent reductase (Old Yellow Enzyme family)
MNSTFEPLFQPFTFPVSGVRISNRVLMSPMTTWSGNADGTVSDAEIAYYARRSRGVGAVITACAYVMPQGQGFAGQIGIHDDRMIPSLKKIADTIHEGGTKAIIQIYHGGRMSPSVLLPDKQPVSASNIPAAYGNAPVPREMTSEEIDQTIRAFGQAAQRAITAGFDGVEIHGANTYLIQQFFSPHANRRTDRWGGSLEKRMTFPLAVVDEVIGVIQKHLNRPVVVGYRLSPEEAENPGITMEETLQLAGALAAKKLDYLHVSTMDFWQGSMRDTSNKRPRAALVIESLGGRIPVIGVGSIHTPNDALRILETGIPLIALGRELLMEPDWVLKVQDGQEDRIRTTLPKDGQRELVLPDGLWQAIMSRKGWLPVV